MESVIGKKVFEYDNYRFFLKDFFEEQKEMMDSFSHRAFAKKAGFASSSFFSHVIDGKRNLTDSSLNNMLKGVSLQGKQATYFKTLVLYNQADTIQDRELYYAKLLKMRKRSELFKVNEKQWSYYDEWYYPIIRELAPLNDWAGDFKKLGELVNPIITPDKAKKAVQVLIDIDMLRLENDTYVQSHGTVSAADVPAVVTRKMRRKYIHLAEEAMENLPLEERLIAGVTVTLSDEQYRTIEEKLNDIRKEILSIGVNGDNEPGKVYQVNLQAFPLSDEVTLSSTGGDDA